MKKIPTLFLRDEKTKRVTPSVNPECDWVFRGEGTPTRKFDGTCCMIRGGRLFKRYDAKKVGYFLAERPLPSGKSHGPIYEKPVPAEFEPCDHDPVTGHTPGWVPVGVGPEDRWFREALVRGVDYMGNVFHRPVDVAPDGTYELCGPKVQGNPEGFDSHVLIPHGCDIILDCPCDFDGLRSFLEESIMEGVVWRHADGPMAKVKRRDYGLRWPT